MTWNWQLPAWPRFRYDPTGIYSQDKQFLLGLGSNAAFLKAISEDERNQFVVEILSIEGEKSSKIEGEFLVRETLQSSIRNHFDLNNGKNSQGKEDGMAELLCDAYKTYDEPLTHEMLYKWHYLLFKDSNRQESSHYREHVEPMQIISQSATHLPLLSQFWEEQPLPMYTLKVFTLLKMAMEGLAVLLLKRLFHKTLDILPLLQFLSLSKNIVKNTMQNLNAATEH